MKITRFKKKKKLVYKIEAFIIYSNLIIRIDCLSMSEKLYCSQSPGSQYNTYKIDLCFRKLVERESLFQVELGAPNTQIIECNNLERIKKKKFPISRAHK